MHSPAHTTCDFSSLAPLAFIFKACSINVTEPRAPQGFYILEQLGELQACFVFFGCSFAPPHPAPPWACRSVAVMRMQFGVGCIWELQQQAAKEWVQAVVVHVMERVVAEGRILGP